MCKFIHTGVSHQPIVSFSHGTAILPDDNARIHQSDREDESSFSPMDPGLRILSIWKYAEIEFAQWSDFLIVSKKKKKMK